MDDEKNFLHFFGIFHDLNADATRIHFSSFVEREIGPSWITKPTDPSDPGNVVIWSHCLCRTLLFDGLPGEKESPAYVYLPNIEARQFGIC